MNLKIFFLVSLFITNLFAVNFSTSDLTKNEIKLLKTIKAHGKKYGLSYSLMAIAIKESSLGKYIVNVDSKDYGVYQANIRSVLDRYKEKDTKWNRNVYATKLVTDFQFATKNAIEELIFWKKIHNNNWRKVWSSYNAGWRYNSKKAKNYSRDIAKIIRKLKKSNV